MLDKFKEILKKEYYQTPNNEIQNILDNTLEHKSFIIKDTLHYLTENADKFIGMTEAGKDVNQDTVTDENPLFNDETYTAIFKSLLEENYTPPLSFAGIQSHLLCLSIFYDYVLVTLDEGYYKDTNPISQYALLIRLDVAFSLLLQVVGAGVGIIDGKVFHKWLSDRANDAIQANKERKKQAVLMAVQDILTTFPDFKEKKPSWKAEKVHWKLVSMKKDDKTIKIPSHRTIKRYLEELDFGQT
jgi:hypothetical protein